MAADETTPLISDRPDSKEQQPPSWLQRIFNVENRLLFTGFLITLSFSYTQVPYVHPALHLKTLLGLTKPLTLSGLQVALCLPLHGLRCLLRQPSTVYRRRRSMQHRRNCGHYCHTIQYSRHVHDVLRNHQSVSGRLAFQKGRPSHCSIGSDLRPSHQSCCTDSGPGSWQDDRNADHSVYSTHYRIWWPSRIHVCDYHWRIVRAGVNACPASAHGIARPDRRYTTHRADSVLTVFSLLVNVIAGEIAGPERRTILFGKLQGTLMLGQAIAYLGSF